MIRELIETLGRSRYCSAVRALRQRLKSIGIEITPYYWIQEGLSDNALPEPQGNFGGYSFEFFEPEEMKVIGKIPGRKWRPEKELISFLSKGNKCFGVKYQGKIAAFNWFDFDGSSCKWDRFRLEDGEAYLFDMHTMEALRGKGIAPCLRYQSYKVLRKMGRDKFYSVSEFFNIPSIRFKEKLGARFLELRLYIRLSDKHQWCWKIRDFTWKYSGSRFFLL